MACVLEYWSASEEVIYIADGVNRKDDTEWLEWL